MLSRCMGAGEEFIMSVFEKLNNDNGAKILNEFQEIEYHLDRYIDSVAGTEKVDCS